MSLFEDGDVGAFGRRNNNYFGGGGGGGVLRCPPGRRDNNTLLVEIESGDEPRVVGETVDGDEVVEVAYDVVEAELDNTGAMTGRGRRVGRKVRTILRQRQRNYDNFLRRDENLAARQMALEQRGRLPHQDPAFLRQQQVQARQQVVENLASHAVGKPLLTSQSIAAGATATYVLTPQYDLTISQVYFTSSGTGTLGGFLITNFQIGVDPLASNPEATTGFLASILDPANTQPSIFAGRMVRAQSPIRFSAQNNNGAAASLTVFISGKTNAAQLVG